MSKLFLYNILIRGIFEKLLLPLSYVEYLCKIYVFLKLFYKKMFYKPPDTTIIFKFGNNIKI